MFRPNGLRRAIHLPLHCLCLPNQCLVWLRSHTTLIGLKTKLLELSHVRLEQVGRVGRVIVLPVR